MENLQAERKIPADDARLVGVWDQFYAHCFSIINQCPGVRKLAAPDRDDCVQDVLMEVVRKFGATTGGHREDVTRWVRVLSRNKAADIVRRRYRKPEVLFDDGAGAAVLDSAHRRDAAEAPGAEDVALVWEALQSLDAQVPVTSYLIFYLRTIEGWDIPEIAELFQISPEQARARCHRVRKKFRSLLKNQGGTRPT